MLKTSVGGKFPLFSQPWKLWDICGYMGVSKNRGTPKWMVSPVKWMIWEYHYFWKHPYVDIKLLETFEFRPPKKTPKHPLRSLQTVFRAPDFKVKLDIDFQKRLDEMTSWHPSPGGGEVSRRFPWSDGSERYHPPEVVGMGVFC